MILSIILFILLYLIVGSITVLVMMKFDDTTPESANFSPNVEYWILVLSVPFVILWYGRELYREMNDSTPQKSDTARKG